eukprot:2091324-Rhodomonas_salina.2
MYGTDARTHAHGVRSSTHQSTTSTTRRDTRSALSAYAARCEIKDKSRAPGTKRTGNAFDSAGRALVTSGTEDGGA